MSDHVLLNLFNEFWKRDQVLSFAQHLLFSQLVLHIHLYRSTSVIFYLLYGTTYCYVYMGHCRGNV